MDTHKSNLYVLMFIFLKKSKQYVFKEIITIYILKKGVHVHVLSDKIKFNFFYGNNNNMGSNYR